MYYPYFRGKQNELLTIRESASSLAVSGFVPIIEPVKEALGGLARALDAVCRAEGEAIVIVNPKYGDHSDNGESISSLLRRQFVDQQNVSAGILLEDGMTTLQALERCHEHLDHGITLVHAGFTNAKDLADGLGQDLVKTQHVFVEPFCGKLYRKHFAKCKRILLRDGFQRRRNRDYPPLELFSDLHATFGEEGMNGFGDFLTVGDDYQETGGPAYAIAIHLTFIDRDKDDAMYIYHFVSERQDTPTDPAGKFAEALRAMINKLDESGSKILESSAVAEFRALHAKGHFPGLGYIKKLSMQHHIETMREYFT